MPLDASDNIRKMQELAIFQGYISSKEKYQFGVNVSSCATFYSSTINTFSDYELRQQTINGRKYFAETKGQS